MGGSVSFREKQEETPWTAEQVSQSGSITFARAPELPECAPALASFCVLLHNSNGTVDAVAALVQNFFAVWCPCGADVSHSLACHVHVISREAFLAAAVGTFGLLRAGTQQLRATRKQRVGCRS